jgi:branched-chain amino acid transport system substrate-binding protein
MTLLPTVGRRLILGGLATALAAPPIIGRARADDTVKMASILDLSGGLAIYGKSIHMCMQLATEDINASGGLNGKKLEMLSYDTQSNMQLYAQYAQQAALQDHVDLVHGAITSASREVIRPILDRYKTLLMYSTQYEGGVCDINTFCTGATPAMQVTQPLKWAINKWGKKIFVIGADYNAPRIFGMWAKYFAKEYGATVIDEEYFPLDVTEFGPVITKIQQMKPDIVYSIMVGAAQMGFYRQWASAGLTGKMPLMSFSFGAGNEDVMLPADVTNGIIVPSSYFRDIDTPENKDFIARFSKRFNTDATALNNTAIGGYEGTMIWAAAVRKAGTADRMKVIEAMGEVSFTGPAGTIKIDPETHHASRDIYLGQVENKHWNILQVLHDQKAADFEGRCNLVTHPRTDKQFVPEI